MRHVHEIAENLFERARDIILVLDAESGAIIDANLAAERAYRLSRAELLARTVFDLRASDHPPVAEQLQLARVTGTLFETVHRRGDGSTFPVEVSSRGEQVAARSCLYSIIRDITERKRLEAERDRLLATTQRALAARDEFLTIAAHELRAPITNVSLQLQQLDRLIARGAPISQVQVAGEHALRATARLTTLIDTLVDAQVARGPLTLALTDIDLAELVHAATERLRVRADECGSGLVIAVPSILGRWDCPRLDQAITNVLLNALKYGCGKPIYITAVADATSVQLTVRDGGIGVRVEDLERIFGKFERAVHLDYGGLGLGLFITRQIVEAHGGRIEVESAPDEGATFRLQLPLRPAIV